MLFGLPAACGPSGLPGGGRLRRPLFYVFFVIEVVFEPLVLQIICLLWFALADRAPGTAMRAETKAKLPARPLCFGHWLFGARPMSQRHCACGGLSPVL